MIAAPLGQRLGVGPSHRDPVRFLALVYDLAASSRFQKERV